MVFVKTEERILTPFVKLTLGQRKLAFVLMDLELTRFHNGLITSIIILMMENRINWSESDLFSQSAKLLFSFSKATYLKYACYTLSESRFFLVLLWMPVMWVINRCRLRL